MNARSRTALVVCFALAPACRVGTDYRAPRAATVDAWAESGAIATSAPVREDWWRAFEDEELTALVDAALAQNLDLALARERVLEARALRDAAAGGDDPQIDLGAGYEHARRSRNELGAASALGPREGELFSAGFDARWELDLFGRNADALDAARRGVEAAIEARRDATVTLLGEIARTYVELRGAQREAAVARANVASQAETVALTQARFQAGMSSELDLARAQALARSTAAIIPPLEGNVRVAIHRLGVLLARDPGVLGAQLSQPRAIPSAPATIAAGLPAELLRRRPDVRRAERELAREAALSNVARAELYPRLTLAGSWGQRSSESGELTEQDSNAWSLGANLVAPILEAGIRRANVRAQEARQRAALIDWQRAVLAAQAEVEDALVSLARERERNVELAGALDAQRRAAELANDLFTRGLADFFEVLDAQRRTLEIESDLARSSTRAAANAVALYKALGGGWEVAERSEADRERATDG